jgi:hypothetical protein
VTALIIGDRGDSHVQAVMSAIDSRAGSAPLVLDAPALERDGFFVDLDRVLHNGADVSLHDGGSGWLRRYAPTAWGTGSVAGSRDAVTKRAFLSLIGSITRLGNRRWLTTLDAMLNSEDRLVQLQAARALNIRIPDTIVTSDPNDAVARLGPSFLVKPLSGGYFWTDDGPRAVFTSRLDADEATRVDFAAAPFVAQEHLHVITHLRVVTVRDRAWVGGLTGHDRPLDWRQQDEAHFAWQPVEDDEACDGALRLAKSLGVGYTSQDWIRDAEGVAFLDLNPGGQWLFLPPAVSDPVTDAIAQFLRGPGA